MPPAEAYWRRRAAAPKDSSTWTRPILEPRPAERDARVHSIFYGYPAPLIAEWCSVSVEEADAWKIGTAEPSRQALKLFALHATGHVVPPEFREFRFCKGRLVDPQGEAFSPSLLEGYSLMLQFLAELARRSQDPTDRERYYQLLKSAVA